MPRPHPVLPMTIDEFQHMRHWLGWKHEYWDGAAQLSTQETAVASFQRPVAPITAAIPLAADEQLRLIQPDDEPALIELFMTAFDEAIEYVGWPDDSYRREARDSIGTFFGKPSRYRYGSTDLARLDASFVIATPTQLLAAVLVRSIRRGPILQPIMVHPAHHRRGLATALLSAVMSSLLSAGDAALFSRCQLGNAPSMAWHERNGFLEIPDYFAATHRWRHFAWLVDHFEHAQQPGQAAEMRQLAEHWKAVVATIEESQGRWASALLD